MPPRTGPLDKKALKRITADIAALDKRVDTVVVLSHWGTQYTHRPEASQRTAAKAFADAGADLVIGGHPHWVQGLQRFGSTPVVYSLGNYVFDMDFQTKTNEGVILEVVLWGGRVKAVEPVPYVIDRNFVPALGQGWPCAGHPGRPVGQQPRSLVPARLGSRPCGHAASRRRRSRIEWLSSPAPDRASAARWRTSWRVAVPSSRSPTSTTAGWP